MPIIAMSEQPLRSSGKGIFRRSLARQLGNAVLVRCHPAMLSDLLFPLTKSERTGLKGVASAVSAKTPACRSDTALL